MAILFYFYSRINPSLADGVTGNLFCRLTLQRPDCQIKSHPEALGLGSCHGDLGMGENTAPITMDSMSLVKINLVSRVWKGFVTFWRLETPRPVITPLEKLVLLFVLPNPSNVSTCKMQRPGINRVGHLNMPITARKPYHLLKHQMPRSQPGSFLSDPAPHSHALFLMRR